MVFDHDLNNTVYFLICLHIYTDYIIFKTIQKTSVSIVESTDPQSYQISAWNNIHWHWQMFLHEQKLFTTCICGCTHKTSHHLSKLSRYEKGLLR